MHVVIITVLCIVTCGYAILIVLDFALLCTCVPWFYKLHVCVIVSFCQSFAESLSCKSLVYENCEPLTLTSSRARRHYILATR